jgi:hypothetical protein
MTIEVQIEQYNDAVVARSLNKRIAIVKKGNNTTDLRFARIAEPGDDLSLLSAFCKIEKGKLIITEEQGKE